MSDEAEKELVTAQKLQDLLIGHATGSNESSGEYQEFRRYFLASNETKERLPNFVKQCRDLGQFWQFIKHEFSTYAERRTFIYGEFAPLLDYLESSAGVPADLAISATLKSFDESGVHAVWQRALARRTDDPEGAITSARTLVETVCKHILDELSVPYDTNRVELHELYKLTAKELNLSPSQHTEEVFRQILGGCSAIVNGLGTLRNRLGDAHGQGKLPVRPHSRHAELAVNLAGSLSIFLIATYEARHDLQ